VLQIRYYLRCIDADRQNAPSKTLLSPGAKEVLSDIEPRRCFVRRVIISKRVLRLN